MAKIVKAEVQETDDESKLITSVETPSTSTTFPTFLHNQTQATPFFWSFQPLDGLPLQSGSQSISGITRQLPIPLGEFKPSDQLTRKSRDDEQARDSFIYTSVPLADAIPCAK